MTAEDFANMAMDAFKNGKQDEGVAYFYEAAKMGDPAAMCNIGIFYDEGISFEQDAEKAFYWFQKAAEAGYAYAMSKIGDFYSKQGNDNEAFKWYLKAAENGSVHAMGTVASMYLTGVDVEKNVKEGLKWLKRTVEFENDNKKFMLERLHMKGISDKDIEEAFDLAVKAESSENSPAQKELGKFNLETLDIEEFEEIGLIYLAEMAEMFGNIDKAFSLYLRAAKFGDAFSMFKVGDFYSKQKNDAEAFKWQIKAAEAGAPYAMTEIATMYFQGAGVEKNDAECLNWLKKAVELKNPSAMTLLARMYELGIVVEQDINEALKLYVEAANAGEEHAKQRLETLFKEGT